MQQFGEYLSNLRSNKGLTLEKLAKLVGSSKSTLSRLENDDIPRPFKGAIRKMIIHLAQVLCTSKQETERYLQLAGIDISLLTENEKKLLGLTPNISINTPAQLHTDDILILNFAHPLTAQQQTQIEKLSGTNIKDIINEEERLLPQIINPPGYAPAALLLLAEIHGRIGHFPTLIRMRPKHGPVTTYHIIELLNLQTTRDAARTPIDARSNLGKM